MSVTIEQDLKEILTKIDQRLESLEKIANATQVEIATIRVKVETIEREVNEVKNTQKSLIMDIADLKGVKSLFIPILVAVITAFLTLLGRFLPIS